MESGMKKFIKNVSRIGCVFAASAFIASMVVVPAFAADPVYRKTAGTAYTETVAYDSEASEAKTEVLIDTEFSYLDFSLEVDVTYAWDEDLVWTYVRNGQNGFWTKADSEESSWDYVKLVMGEDWIKSATGYEDTRLDLTSWEEMNSKMSPSITQNVDDALCNVMLIENKAINNVKVYFGAAPLTISATTDRGKAYSTTSYSNYFSFKGFYPADATETTTRYTFDSEAEVYNGRTVIGTDSAVIESKNGIQANQVYVGVYPKATFVPSEGWIANNRGGVTITGALRLQFWKE